VKWRKRSANRHDPFSCKTKTCEPVYCEPPCSPSFPACRSINEAPLAPGARVFASSICLCECIADNSNTPRGGSEHPPPFGEASRSRRRPWLAPGFVTRHAASFPAAQNPRENNAWGSWHAISRRAGHAENRFRIDRRRCAECLRMRRRFATAFHRLAEARTRVSRRMLTEPRRRRSFLLTKRRFHRKRKTQESALISSKLSNNTRSVAGAGGNNFPNARRFCRSRPIIP